MEELTALVADIQRSSLHDGPGIRTTVFFKGCPLHCAWCHNPECISPKPQTMYYPERCIHCGMCEQGCYSGAKVLCGKEMTAREILAEILQDRDYYGAEGGVTFSGGEPLLHERLLSELIDLCHDAGIHTAVETSLILFPEDVIKKLDFVMADYKILDPEKHRQYTGISNEIITRNFARLDKLGIPFLVRTPIIPGVNDTPEEIAGIRDRIKDFRNIKGYELLPYHPLGVSKQAALGMTQTRFEVPSREHMEELRHYADISRSH